MHRIRIITVILILLFYYWTASTSKADGTYSFRINERYLSQYDLLTRAFFDRRLDLPINVPKKLLELENPYNSNANASFRVGGFHDVSLYKGKAYIYFGPTPVITLLLPYYCLPANIKTFVSKIDPKSNNYMSSNLAILIFSFGTLIWASLFLFYIKEKYFQDIPEWMISVSILVLGLCNLSPFLLRRPFIYEIAISSGCFFLMGAIYFFSISFKNTIPNLIFMSLGGLFIGLSAGCRPHFIITGTLITFIVLLKIMFSNIQTIQSSKKNLAITLIAPILICYSLLLIYNYIRFNEITEFGISYQLGSKSGRRDVYKDLFMWGSICNILKRFSLYTLQPPVIKSYFPYIFLHSLGTEKVAGTIPLFPFVTLTFVSPFLYLRHKLLFKFRFTEIIFSWFEFLLLTITTLANLGFLTIYRSTTMRHTGDYLSTLILCTSIIWFYFYIKLKDTFFLRRILSFFAILSAFVSIINGTAISITGCYWGLRSQNPKQFRLLESKFKPISNIISQFVD